MAIYEPLSFYEGLIANSVKTPQFGYAYLEICDGKNFLVRLYWDGRLEYGPTYTPEAAARVFWESLAGFAPYRNNDNPAEEKKG